MNKLLFSLFIFFVSVVSGVSAVSLEFIDSDFSKVETNNIYYVGDSKVNLVVANVENNLTLMINDLEKLQISADINTIISVPENSNFNVELLDGSTVVYSYDFTTQKVLISDISTIITSNNLVTKESIKYKIIINNDETKDELILTSEIFDFNDNLVNVKTESFTISANSNLAKLFSFVPEVAGDYTIKNTVTSKGFVIRQNEKVLNIQVTKPDIILSLARSEIAIPSDVVATVSIRNPKTTRTYELTLKILNPSGDTIEELNKEISLTSESVRSVIFSTSFDEDFEAGEYILLLETKFKESGETYVQETQKTLTVITPSANVLVSLKSPTTVEVSKDFRFILGLNHLSTKQFKYTYQCFFYDENNFLSHVYPQNPNTLTLSSQDQRDLKLSFKIPSDFKTGRYNQECKVIYGNDKFLAVSEFTVSQPDNYINLRASSQYNNFEAKITAGYSTKSIKEINGFINIFLYDENDKLIDSDLNNEVVLNGKLREFKAKFILPKDVSAQSVNVVVELDALDELHTEELELVENKNFLELYCSSDFVTPQTNKVTCSVAGISSSSGIVYAGIVKSNIEISEIKRFSESNTAIFMNSQKKNLVETKYNNVTNVSETVMSELVFNFDFANIKESKAKIVAVFVDDNGLASSKDFLVSVIPKGASIGTIDTYAEKYYNDDRKKPLSVLETYFQQDLNIKSSSNSNIEVKIVARSSSDTLLNAGESQTIKLAPMDSKIITFRHKQTRNKPLSMLFVNYDVFLLVDNTEYLIDSYKAKTVAPSIFYDTLEPAKEFNLGGYVWILVVIIVAGCLVFVFYIMRDDVKTGLTESSSMSNKSTPVPVED